MRYYAFAGDTFYPGGGSADLVGMFDDAEAAIQAAREGGWGEVLDVLTGRWFEIGATGPYAGWLTPAEREAVREQERAERRKQYAKIDRPATMEWRKTPSGNWSFVVPDVKP